MQTVTIKELLNGADPDGQIYILRADDCVLYVGKASAGIAYRWLDRFGGRMYQDVGGKLHGNDSVANTVVLLMPDSLKWQLDCYEQEDAARLCIDEYTQMIKERSGHTPNYAPDRLSLDTVEQMCIQVMRPCLNSQHNSNPRPLPESIADVLANRGKTVQQKLYAKYQEDLMRKAVESIYIPE